MDRLPTIRQERTGSVHIRKGVVIGSKGRDLSETWCGNIIAGIADTGPETAITCPECREAKAGRS